MSRYDNSLSLPDMGTRFASEVPSARSVRPREASCRRLVPLAQTGSFYATLNTFFFFNRSYLNVGDRTYALWKSKSSQGCRNFGCEGRKNAAAPHVWGRVTPSRFAILPDLSYFEERRPSDRGKKSQMKGQRVNADESSIPTAENFELPYFCCYYL